MCLRRYSVALGSLALATLTAACTHHARDVTPWLRLRSHHQLELIAESGGGPYEAWAKADRKVNGTWIELPFGGVAFAFANGTRAVLDGKLLTDDGRTIDIGCDGDLHAGPDDRLRCTIAFTA
jgi:hypothetical protein